MRYALLRHSGVGAASCRCWCAPIECGPSAACTGELVTRLMCLASWLMCLVCGGAVAAALERTAQPDATEWLWCWCKPIGYRQHGLGRQLSQLQAPSPPRRACHAVQPLADALQWLWCWCKPIGYRQRSGSGVGASRSGIGSTDGQRAVQADRVSAARTRTAAESTTCLLSASPSRRASACSRMAAAAGKE